MKIKKEENERENKLFLLMLEMVEDDLLIRLKVKEIFKSRCSLKLEFLKDKQSLNF